MALGPMLFVDDTAGMGPNDVRIINPTVDVQWFDFSPVAIDSIVAAGAATARRALEGACVRPLSAGAPRIEPTVPSHVQELTVAGQNPIERAALRTSLGLRAGGPLNQDSLRLRLISLGKSDALRGLWLTPTGGDSAVDLDVQTVRAGRQVMIVGLAYDNDMGGRLWGGLADRRLFGLSVEGAVAADVGKYRRELRGILRQQVAFTGRAFPIYGAMSLLDEDVRVFRDSVEFDPARVDEFSIGGGVQPRLGELWTLDLRAEFRAWSEPGRRNGPTAVGLHVDATRSSFSRRAVLTFEGLLNTDYHRVALELAAPLTVRRFELAPSVRVGWGERLPAHQSFALGGTDGFAGFIIGERRGDHEAVVSLSLARAIVGPVYGRAEMMAGAVGSGRRFLDGRTTNGITYLGQRVGGGRIGAEVRTPALDIRLEQGFNDRGRTQAFIRIGRWY
jgi:hypothetical protein